MQTLFTIKSTEDLKSKHKTMIRLLFGQTLSWLAARKRNLLNKEPSARYTLFRLLIAKISFPSRLPIHISCP